MATTENGWLVGRWSRLRNRPILSGVLVGFRGVYLSLMSFAGENPCMRLFRIMGCNELQFGGLRSLGENLENYDKWQTTNGYQRWTTDTYWKVWWCLTLPTGPDAGDAALLVPGLVGDSGLEKDTTQQYLVAVKSRLITLNCHILIICFLQSCQNWVQHWELLEKHVYIYIYIFFFQSIPKQQRKSPVKSFSSSKAWANACLRTHSEEAAPTLEVSHLSFHRIGDLSDAPSYSCPLLSDVRFLLNSWVWIEGADQ